MSSPTFEAGPVEAYLPLTSHARRRMSARNISAAAVLATLCNGRIVRTPGAEIHILGRRQVTLAQRRGLEVSAHEGVHVICSPMGRILTVYRNRNPRRLQSPHGCRRGRR